MRNESKECCLNTNQQYSVFLLASLLGSEFFCAHQQVCKTEVSLQIIFLLYPSSLSHPWKAAGNPCNYKTRS